MFSIQMLDELRGGVQKQLRISILLINQQPSKQWPSFEAPWCIMV